MERVFNFRYDDAFMAVIEDWRAQQRPVPSKAEAIRRLVSRGAALDNYLELILEKSITDLVSRGYVAKKDPETYRRLKQVVMDSLDQAARVDLQRAQDHQKETPKTPVRALRESLETPAQDSTAPKQRRYSR